MDLDRVDYFDERIVSSGAVMRDLRLTDEQHPSAFVNVCQDNSHSRRTLQSRLEAYQQKRGFCEVMLIVAEVRCILIARQHLPSYAFCPVSLVE
jgi:hypothetical protein